MKNFLLILAAAFSLDCHGATLNSYPVSNSVAPVDYVLSFYQSPTSNSNFTTHLLPANPPSQLPPLKHFAFGDSLNCQLTNDGWFSFGGYSNANVTGYTNGTAYYRNGAYSSTNLSIWAVWTNNIFQNKGYVVQLDTSGCVPGATMGNIWGGYQGYMAHRIDQNAPATYNANGSNTVAIANQWANWGSCWIPGANDTGITVGGVAYTLANCQTNNGIVFVQITNLIGTPFGSYNTAVCYGTPSASCTFEIRCPWYGPDYFTPNYFPPYTLYTGANAITNLSAFPLWAVGYSNAPVLTGVPASASLFAGINDGAYGNFQGSVTNTIQFTYSNQVSALRQLVAWGYNPVYLLTTPRVYSFLLSDTILQQSNVVTLQNLERSTIIPGVRVMDIDAWIWGANYNGDYQAGYVSSFLGDHVHWSGPKNITNGFEIYTNGANGLVPNVGFFPGDYFANSVNATNWFSLPTNYLAANFIPMPGTVKIVASNNWLFTVTPWKTNALLQTQP